MRSILVLIFLIIPFSFSCANEEINAGIIKGLWFSEEPFFAGEELTVYTAIQNTSGADLSGDVEFLVNGNSFETKAFYVNADKQIIVLSTNIIPEEGSQKFEVKITKAERISNGSSEERVVKTYTTEEKRDVDLDTDGDGIGNKDDSDDDGDGYSDKDEKKSDSDPLDPESFPAPKEPVAAPPTQIVSSGTSTAASFLDPVINTSGSSTVAQTISTAAGVIQSVVRTTDSVRDGISQTIDNAAVKQTNKLDPTNSLTPKLITETSTDGTVKNYSPLWEKHREIFTTPEVSIWTKLWAGLLTFGKIIFWNLWSFLIFLVLLVWIIKKIFWRKDDEDEDENFWD